MPPARGGFPAHRVAALCLGALVAVVALVALFAGPGAGPVVAAEPGSVAVDRLYRQGVRLLRQGHLVTAETVFQKVLRQAPDHFKTHLTLGKFYLSRQPALAHHHLIIALTQRPGSDAVHYQLGRYLEGEEALPEAAESYRKAIALNPRNFRANDRLRGILRRLRAEQTVLERAAESFLASPSVATLTFYGRIVMEYASPRQALWEFESMRERLPELPELNLWVARAQGRLGSPEGEIAAYQAYLEKNREALRVRLVLLDRLLQVGAFRQAEENLALLEERLDDPRVAPDDAGRILFLRSRLLVGRGEPLESGRLLLRAGRRGYEGKLVAAAFRQDLSVYPRQAELWRMFAEWANDSGNPVQAAEAYHRTGMLAPELRGGAVENLKKLARLDGAAAPATLALGELALADGNEQEAVAWLRTVPQTDPAGRRAALLLGLIQQRRGDLEESLASLARYVFSFADRGGMVYARGYLFWEMGNRELAIHVWNEGLRDLAGYPDPLEKMAGHFRDQGNAPREFAVRNALREAAPDNLANRVRLGDLLMAAGRQDEALREWEEITARKPGDFELLRRLGKAYLAQGDVERGVEALRRASQVKELEPELTELLGRNLVALGHNDKALEIYWRLHALQPEHPELRRVLPDLVLKTPAHQEVRLAAARLAERTSRPELAIDILEDLLRVWPDDQEARRLLTALFLNRGEAEEAERVALASGEAGTAFDIRQLRLLWDAQLRLANKKGLIVTLAKILEIDPGEEPARRQQGLLLAEFGRFEEALPLLSASHRAGAGDPEILWQLGRAQWATGHGNEAAAVLKRLTKREPGHEGANRTLIQIYREGKRWKELAVKLEAWVAARPDDNQARIDLITAYLKEFKVEEARPHYEALTHSSPLRARRLARYFR